MTRIIDYLARSAGLVAAVATVLMMVHVTTAVLLRVGFNAQITGTIDIVTYFYMVSAIFLGIFVAAWHDAHIRVDVIANLFPGRVRRLTDVFSELVTLVFFLFFSWGLWRTALQKTHQRETVDAIFAHLTVWPMRWVAFAGVVLAALVIVWRLPRVLIGKTASLEIENPFLSDDEAQP